jgi:hypothetical protein
VSFEATQQDLEAFTRMQLGEGLLQIHKLQEILGELIQKHWRHLST